MKKPVVLCVLDGWGEAEPSPYNALTQASLPNWTRFREDYPWTTLSASGEDVGLPEGQMGNSEVGHLTLGAGRIILQDLPRINRAVEEGSLNSHPLLEHLKNQTKRIHLMGLFSPGGVHSHMSHLHALIEALQGENIEIFIHAFLDGRDTPPQSATRYLDDFLNDTKKFPNLTFATVMGRYYAMDRDKRWDRIEKAYRAIVSAEGVHASSPHEAITQAYEKSQSDEFVVPTVIGNYEGVREGDAILMANFRADRVRQILSAFTNPKFQEFPIRPLHLASCIGMTNYGQAFQGVMQPLFPTQTIKQTLGETIAQQGLTQLRIAETEKYAHVTFFFDGGREMALEGEDRLLIPSPKVSTYDLAPEMSALEVTRILVEKIKRESYDFIVVNYANADMVGHTGNFEASIRAVEVLDQCLGDLEKAVLQRKGTLVITADHGNVESMYDSSTESPYTAHTCNPVPFMVIEDSLTIRKLRSGKLSDVAPSILSLMGIAQPNEMKGHSLIEV